MSTETSSRKANSLIEAFKEVPDDCDPHSFEHILFISILGVLSGAEGRDDLRLAWKVP
ncbi:MAG: hypothetical protein AAF355_11490 [Myxococcota bacterium]